MLQPRSASTLFESLSVSRGPGPEPFAIALAWLSRLKLCNPGFTTCVPSWSLVAWRCGYAALHGYAALQTPGWTAMICWQCFGFPALPESPLSPSRETALDTAATFCAADMFFQRAIHEGAIDIPGFGAEDLPFEGRVMPLMKPGDRLSNGRNLSHLHTDYLLKNPRRPCKDCR